MGIRGKETKSPEQIATHEQHLDFLGRAFAPSAIPFAAVSPDGRVKAFNPAFCQLTGYSAHEISELNLIDDLTPPQWQGAVLEAWHRLGETGSPQRYERELLRKDGSLVPVELFVHQDCDAQGNVQFYWSFLLDISQRRADETALREGEARYRAIVEAFDGLIYVCGPDYTVEFMNEKMIERTGRNAVGEKCYQALHEREDVCPWCVNERVFAGEKVVWEVQSPKDGNWWYVINTPIHHADGTISKQAMIMDITSRKQAENALRESESKFRALAETTSSAIFIIQDEHFRYMNPAGQRLCGYAWDELSALPFWAIVHPEDRDMVRSRGLSRRGGQPIIARYEFRIITRDGREVWADFTGGFTEFEGRPAILGTAFDITDRKKALLAVKDSQQRWADIINFLPDPTFAVDKDGCIIAWNRAVEELTGVPAERMVGKGDHEYAIPFYGKRRAVLLDLAMRWDESVERLYPHVTRDNDTLLTEVYLPDMLTGAKHLWAKATPLYDSEGKIVGAIESVRDVTPRKNMEQALRDSAEKHQALVRSLPVGVVTMDAQYRVTELNAEGEIITGYTQREALGRYCWEIMQEGDCQIQCPLKMSNQSPKPAGPIETTMYNRRRGRIPVRVSAAHVYDSQGQVVGAVEVFQDISEIKALERERANIVSMFAHDMKSPLVSIQGFALRLLSEPARASQAKREKYLEIIRKEAGKLEALINDFLDFARLETGSLTLNFSATDLDKEFLELMEVFQPRFAQAGITVELATDEKLSVIEADAPRLRRVFTNLLENALKYSQAGTKVSLEAQENGEEVLVTVRDQGIGIAPEELPKIFDVFYRSRTQEKREGHGLGLAGVEAIVKGHGGRVTVASELGKGSAFTVALPKRQRNPAP